MAATAIATAAEARFFQTTLGKKVVMALTGFVLFGFLILHVAGNLGLFAGAERINAYSAMLHHNPGLLWAVRLVLIVSLVAHVRAAVELYRLKAEARPQKYQVKRNRGATFMSLVMLPTGIGLFAFVIYHLLHFTTGTLHSDFIEGDVFHNLISAFSHPAIAAIYLVAMSFVALHLFHGLWSLTQSLGLSHPRYSAGLKIFAAGFAIVLAAGFALVPIAVMAGWVSGR